MSANKKILKEKYCLKCNTVYKHVFYFEKCDYCAELIIIDNSYICRKCANNYVLIDLYGRPDGVIFCSERCQYKYEKPYKLEKFDKLQEDYDEAITKLRQSLITHQSKCQDQ